MKALRRSRALSLLAIALPLGCGAAPLPDQAAPSPPALSASATAKASSWLPESASSVSFEDMAKFPTPGWNVPRQLGFLQQSGELTFLRSEDDSPEMALMVFNPKTGATRVLARAADLDPKAADAKVSREEELRLERQRKRTKGITSYQFAGTDTPVLLVPQGGDIYVREGEKPFRRLTETKDPELDPKLCKAGTHVGFVRGAELFVQEVASGKETPLSKGAKPGVTRGQSDFNAQEEFDEPSGWFWAPDCKTIAFLEVAEAAVGEVAILGFRGNNPDLMQQRYPRAGGANPDVRIHLANRERPGFSRVAKLPDAVAKQDPYLGRFVWSKTGDHLYFVALARSQRTLWILGVESAAANPQAKILHTQQLNTAQGGGLGEWLEMPTLTLDGSGKHLFATLQNAGHTHLAQLDFAAQGSAPSPPRFLTKGDFEVFDVLGSDAQGAVYFVSNRDEVLGRQLYRMTPGKEPERLTTEPGTHEIKASKDLRQYLSLHSATNRPPALSLWDDGRRSEIPFPQPAGLEHLRSAETVELKGADGSKLFGHVLLPRTTSPAQKHPLVLMVYGGPGVQTVKNQWAPRLNWQHLADRGAIVAQIDNRGTAGRGPAFAAPIAGKLGEVELADQLAALSDLQQRYPIDEKRVGIYGHSYGGFMAALAMFRAPERFKVGVAGSPVSDWRLYDTGYTERFMGHPAQFEAGYVATDLRKDVATLRGNLLIVHALMDENVHFQHTAQLIEALVAAQKPFDMFVFPGERHGYRSPDARQYANRMVINYLIDHLGPGHASD